MFINIYISSKNKNSLNAFVIFMQKLSDNKKLNSKILIKLFQQKTIKNFFTVLKSPHVNKTAQTQFEYKVYNKQFTLFVDSPSKLILFLKFFQKKIFSDVSLKIKIKINSYSTKLVSFSNIDSKINKNTNFYLKYLDILGEFNFNNKSLDSSVGRAKD